MINVTKNRAKPETGTRKIKPISKILNIFKVYMATKLVDIKVNILKSALQKITKLLD